LFLFEYVRLSLLLALSMAVAMVKEGRLVKRSVAMSAAVVFSRCIQRMIVVEIKMGACCYIDGAIRW
jgi:hypothetical protein